jgi:hypothetical protein
VIIDFIAASYWTKNLTSLAADGRMIMLGLMGGKWISLFIVDSSDARPISRREGSGSRSCSDLIQATENPGLHTPRSFNRVSGGAHCTVSLVLTQKTMMNTEIANLSLKALKRRCPRRSPVAKVTVLCARTYIRFVVQSLKHSCSVEEIFGQVYPWEEIQEAHRDMEASKNMYVHPRFVPCEAFNS